MQTFVKFRIRLCSKKAGSSFATLLMIELSGTVQTRTRWILQKVWTLLKVAKNLAIKPLNLNSVQQEFWKLSRTVVNLLGFDWIIRFFIAIKSSKSFICFEYKKEKFAQNLPQALCFKEWNDIQSNSTYCTFLCNQRFILNLISIHSSNIEIGDGPDSWTLITLFVVEKNTYVHFSLTIQYSSL